MMKKEREATVVSELDKYPVPMWFINMPPEDYYGMKDRLGASRFKAFTESPLHYLKFADKPDSPALRSGRMIHKAILEHDEFFNEYIVKPEDIGAKNTKAYKAWYADQDQSKEVITETEWQQSEAMKEAFNSSYVGHYLEDYGLAETSILWDHECENGFKIPCKGRLDYLVQQESKVDLIIDYKTCTDASPKAMWKAMKNYKYYFQEAHYVSGYREAWRGDRSARILFIFQEKTAPYDVGACMVDDETFYYALQEYRRQMELLSECFLDNNFPGRNSNIMRWSYDFGNQTEE